MMLRALQHDPQPRLHGVLVVRAGGSVRRQSGGRPVIALLAELAERRRRHLQQFHPDNRVIFVIEVRGP